MNTMAGGWKLSLFLALCFVDVDNFMVSWVLVCWWFFFCNCHLSATAPCGTTPPLLPENVIKLLVVRKMLRRGQVKQ